MENKYVAPSYMVDGFNCPIGAYAHQKWFDRTSLSKTLTERSIQYYQGHIENIAISVCSRCDKDEKTEKYAIWINKKMVYPKSSTAPLP